MKKAAIFLNQCLPLSESFVLHQALALQRYAPHIVATRAVEPGVGLALPTTILNEGGPVGKAREAAFKMSGLSSTLEAAVADADLIHAHFGPSGWMARKLSERTGVPLAVTLHGFDVLKRTISKKQDGRLQAAYADDRDALAQQASAFICVSEYIKKRAIEFGFPESKCVVRYMGIPLKEHATPKRQAQDGDPVRLLAVGRLVPFKGHVHLIEVARKLQARSVDFQLDIIGQGPLRAELEAQAKDIGGVTFHGAVPYPGVQRMMRSADVFCHTSLHQENGQTEAFGLVLLEAQHAGLPVVAFASGGVPEAIDNTRTGYLCDEGDVDAFVERVHDLTYDGYKRAMMSEAAMRFVADEFDNNQLTKLLERTYDDVAKRRMLSA